MSIWNASGGGSDPTIEPRLTNLEDTQYVYELFENIGGSLSGTITPPTGSSILLDRYEGLADAIIVQLVSGVPSDQPVLTAASSIITTTFNTSGDYVLSGTPADPEPSMGLVYQVLIQAKYAHLIPIGTIINKTNLNEPQGTISFRTASTTVDFGDEENVALVTVTDTLITADSVIIPKFSTVYDDLVIQGVNINVSEINPLTDYTLLVGAPLGASGTYTIDITIIN